MKHHHHPSKNPVNWISIIWILHLHSIMKEISHVFESLKPTDPVVINMHQKPDPDAMGSALALYHFIKKLGNPVVVISPTNWADFLKWMPGIEDVIDFESRGELAKKYLSAAKWLFSLDYNHFNRTRYMEGI